MSTQHRVVVFSLGMLAIFGSLRARAQNALDLGFEAGDIGKTPTEWRVTTAGWTGQLTDEKAAAGSRSVKLSRNGAADGPFGNFMRTLPAKEHAGRHVTLSARLLVVGSGRAQMWLRADRPMREIGAFDNMQDRPILGGDWTDAVIDVDIDDDAEALSIGFMAFGDATVFVDALKLKPSAAAAKEVFEARASSGRGVENLAAAARLLAYVRFFHPSDQAVGVGDWDRFAIQMIDRVEGAKNAEELANALRATFERLAPTLSVWAGTPERAPAPAPFPTGAKTKVWWKHHGAGTVHMKGDLGGYESNVERAALAAPPDAAERAKGVVVKDLGGGVACRLPIVVYADETGTLPHGKTPDEWSTANGKPRVSPANRSTRLAGVALGWGVFQHFFPYFDVVKTDWDAALTAALKEAAEDKTETEYVLTLRELVAKLDDGHGHVMNPSMPQPRTLPLALQWAGRDLVIVGTNESVPSEVKTGDVVVSIDGRTAEESYATVSKWISAATDGWRRVMSAQALVASLPTKDPAELALRHPDGRAYTVKLARGRSSVPNTATSKRPKNGAELAPGVVYFDLDAATSEAFQAAMSTLASAKGIVFDLRGYPENAAYDLMEHLIAEPAASPRWIVPLVTRPDREGVEWQETSRWALTPRSPRLTGAIAFVTDGRAISYAESIMAIVEAYKLGEIVGATTAGTNGNINPFQLPGGYVVSWTGMRVLKHDGSRHHGVGIAPTVPATPTPAGIAAGRDEVLEKAVDVVKTKIAKASGPK